MPRRIRRSIAATIALAMALVLQAAIADAAWAKGRGYGYGYGYKGHHYGGHHGFHYRHHYRRGHRHHRHGHGHDHVGLGIAVFVGGLVLGHLLTRSYEPDYPRAVRAAPARAPVRLGNCKPTTGERIIDGRRALMAGTWCTDQYGRGYILQDSVRFVRFLN